MLQVAKGYIRMGTLAFVLYLLLAALVAVVVYLVRSPNIPDGYSKLGVIRTLQVLMTVFRSWAKLRAFISGQSFMGHFKRSFVVFQKLRPKLTQEIHDNFKIEEIEVDGVPARQYTPRGGSSSDKRPGFLYLHGGGWSLGDTDDCDILCLEISRETGAIVISLK